MTEHISSIRTGSTYRFPAIVPPKGLAVGSISSIPVPTLVIPGVVAPTMITIMDVPVLDAFTSYTIDRVIMSITWTKTTSTGGLNWIDAGGNGSQMIQIRESLGPGAWIDAIEIPPTSIHTSAQSESPGGILYGNFDVSGEVTGPGTYDVRWNSAKALFPDLLMYNVQINLMFIFR